MKSKSGKVRIECEKDRPHCSEEEYQKFMSDEKKKNRFIPYYEKTKLINPGRSEESEKKWEQVFEEIKKSKILDLGIHPSAQEGGFTIYYELPNGIQKAFIMGYTELGQWIEYTGIIEDKPKKIKVGSKVKITKTSGFVIVGGEEIYDRVFVVKKINKSSWAKDGNGNVDESFDEFEIVDAETGKTPKIDGKWELDFIPSRKEIMPV